MAKDYPKENDKVRSFMRQFEKESPKAMKGFKQLHQASIKDAALTSKTKELVALGIAITVRCDGCIAFHIHDALQAGAKHDEIVETINVAILMGGGPSVVYGSQALEALKEFEENSNE